MAVKLVNATNATNAALDQIELNPGIGSPKIGKLFGMLKSRRAALPTDFDPATLLKR